jgi:hypothetical protein
MTSDGLRRSIGQQGREFGPGIYNLCLYYLRIYQPLPQPKSNFGLEGQHWVFSRPRLEVLKDKMNQPVH